MTDTILSAAQIETGLRDTLPHWRCADGALSRVYRTHGWLPTMMVVNAIGHLAQAADHHPDLVVSYARVEVRLSTHSAGGITEKDFALAHRIEDVVQWQPAGANPQSYIKYD